MLTESEIAKLMFIRASIIAPASVVAQAAVIAERCQLRELDPHRLKSSLTLSNSAIDSLVIFANKMHSRRGHGPSSVTRIKIVSVLDGDFDTAHKLMDLSPYDLQDLYKNKYRWLKRTMSSLESVESGMRAEANHKLFSTLGTKHSSL